MIRAAHYVPSRQSALRRAAYEATFALTGLFALLRVPRPDVIIGIVPTLGDGVLARLASARFGVPYGLLFQDLMGPAAGHSGVPAGGRVARVTAVGEAWAVGRASATGVVARAFVPYLASLGVAPAAVHHVPNWSRVMTPELSPAETRRRFGWDDGRMVVLHAGNMGYKQGLEQVVDAARLAAQRREPLRFVLAGGGNREAALREAATGLSNVEFLGVQPDGIHASLLAAADVLLLSERDDETDMSLPSKLTSYFAAGRPIVAAVPPSGATAAEVRRSGAGLVVPAAQPEVLLAVLTRVRAASDLAAEGLPFAHLAPNLVGVPILHWLLVRVLRRLTEVHPQQLVIAQEPEQ